MQVIYPFAAIPNHIVRGGHGAINIAVLAALVSHGKTTASIALIAKEVGCDKKSVLPAIRYWVKHKHSVGMKIYRQDRKGSSNIYKIEFVHMTSPENGSGGGPKTGQVPHPKTGYEEEQVRRTIKKRDSPKNFRVNSGLKSVNEILGFVDE